MLYVYPVDELKIIPGLQVCLCFLCTWGGGVVLLDRRRTGRSVRRQGRTGASVGLVVLEHLNIAGGLFPSLLLLPEARQNEEKA